MKVIFKLTTLWALTVSVTYANSCRELKDDVKVHCQVIEDTCKSIKSCLTRRDTCVGRVPKSIPKDPSSCEEVNECMQGIKNHFPSGEKCTYYWSKTESNDGFCTTKRHFLYSEDGCPGKIGGLLNTVAYGLGSEVDTGFTCAPTRKKYQKQEKSCRDAIAAFKKGCQVDQGGRHVMAQEDRDYIAEYEPKKCEFSDRFDRYRQGDFELPQSASTHSERGNDSNRGAVQKRPPIGDDRRPHDGSETIQQ